MQIALGDDNLHPQISKMARGRLSTALIEYYLVGFNSWKFFGTYHVWDYIEDSVKGTLILCRPQFLNIPSCRLRARSSRVGSDPRCEGNQWKQQNVSQ